MWGVPVRTQSRSSGHFLGVPAVWRPLLVAASVAALTVAGSGASLAASGPAAAPQASSIAGSKFKPLAARRDELVKVVVRLQADSVAEARARTATLSLTASEESAVVAAARREHDAIRPTLQGMGARVVSEMQHAINGIGIVVPRKQLSNIAALPGVRSVNIARTYTRTNAVGIPYIGAPLVWQGHPGFRGEGVNVGIIDTGIDYTHADFGGPGTPAAYTAALANDTAPADPTLFGPNAPKVKGGIDLAGDAYNAQDPTSVPVPDPNPLDCNSHGTHVAGTLAGFGVAGGVRYTGPYNQAAYSNTTFDVGPGVAPNANLYAIRVFGCAGSTNLVTEAIDWAIANHLDVISMSLGSPFGQGDSADAIASENATKAGVVVVAAAGNSGPAPYILSTPGSADHTITAAAIDARASIPSGVVVSLSNGSTINAVEANSLPIPSGSVPVVILTAGSGLSLGCNATDYPAGGTPGALVIVSRGTCSFVQKATLATQAGAVGIGVVNNGSGYFSPLITGVTIPFFEMLITDTPTLLASLGTSASLVAGPVPNPLFEVMASFSSGGPRFGDSVFKPSVSAPGVEVISAGMGTGNGTLDDSGTSMATPHISGVAALVRQAHPSWDPTAIAAAVVEAADPTKVSNYNPRISGSGVVQALGAVNTQVVAFGDHRRPSVSFGFDEEQGNLRDTQTLRIKNFGHRTARFSIASSPALTASNVPHVLVVRDSVSVEGDEDVEIPVTIQVPAATVGASHDANGNDVYRDAAGTITLTPVGASNNGVTLTVPYYLVPRVRSNVNAMLTGNLSAKHPTANLRLSNRGTQLPGTADFYSWGLFSPPVGDPDMNTRAVGVQTNVLGGTDSVIVFAVSTWGRMSTAAAFEWDVLIDVNGDGVPDFDLFAADSGAVLTGTANGVLATFLYDLNAGQLVAEFGGEAPTDGSTVELPVFADMLWLSPSNPTFTYTVEFFTETSGYAMPGQGSFNVFSPSISASGSLFQVLPGGTTATVPVAIDPVQWAQTPSLGLMIVSQDNAAGEPEAILLKAH